jgi:acyl-CoA reductase-like NAD-dependent aldehyde dehydrogenase
MTALLRDAKHLIDGELVGSDIHFEVINPALGEPFALCPQATRVQLDNAVKAAAAAFESWRKTSYEER